MKITPTMPGNHPTATMAGPSQPRKSTATTATTLSADDITQAGLQSAQQTLNDQQESDIDSDKVAQMQAMLASGSLQVDTEQLASDMLSFFQNWEADEVSIRLQQVKALLQGIRDDDALYDSLRELLQRQRICMIRRAREDLLAVNDEITQHYEQLHAHSHQRHSLLKMLGVNVNRDGLAQVFAWLPAVQKAAAQQLWQRLEQKAERCKAYNDKNGELLIRQYEFIQAFLGSEADFLYQG